MLLGVVVVAGWAVVAGWNQKPLLAHGLHSLDSDLDGVPDRQEKVLGLRPNRADTDNDGFTDGEELALRTSPLLADEFPDCLELSIGMSARGESGRLKVFIVIYSPDTVTDKVIRIGALANGVYTNLGMDRLLSIADVSEISAKSGGTLATIDLDFPEALVHHFGQVTIFAVIGERGKTSYTSAAKVDISSQSQVVFLRRHPQSSGASPLGFSATVHQPIPPAGNSSIPTGWAPGRICYQISEVVAVSGAVVKNQIIDAGCEGGWDSYCDDTECEATVNSTYDTVDIGVLLGG